MRHVGPWLVLAACSSEGAVELRVMPPVDGTVVEEVELYVGIHGAHRDDAIRPAHGLLAPTVWWKRDESEIYRQQLMTPDGVLYQLLRSDKVDSLAAIVAVGFASRSLDDTTKQPVAVGTLFGGLDIPPDEIHRYQLQLGSFDPLPGEVDTELPGLQVWGPPDNPRACVQVDDVRELAEHDKPSAMIVTRDDIDCDGYADADPVLECRANQPSDPVLGFEYMARDPISRDSLSCVKLAPVTGQTGPVNACIVGGNGCADGDVDGCQLSNYCAPTSLCSACSDIECTALPTTVPHIVCYLPTQDTGGGVSICGSAHASLDMQLYFLGIECNAELGTKVRTLDQPFGTELTYTSVVGATTKIAMSVDNATKCQFTFHGEGVFSQGYYLGVLAMPLTSGPKRGLALPIIFRSLGNACSIAEGSCNFNSGAPDPALLGCISSPVPDPRMIVVD